MMYVEMTFTLSANDSYKMFAEHDITLSMHFTVSVLIITQYCEYSMNKNESNHFVSCTIKY